MNDSQATTRLEMRWHPSTDRRGREIMEPCWVLVDAEQVTAPAAAA